MQSEGEAGARRANPDAKYIGDLTGSYLLASREASPEGEPRVFGCRSRSVSARMVVLQAPVRGTVGEKLVLKLDTLGLLKARIVRLNEDGFVADLTVGEKEAETLAARIDWLKQRYLKSLPDRREGKRWLPRDSRSSLILSDKRELDCFIIDVSATGVAVSADVAPQLGHPIVIGAVLGRVVRRFECGFAVEFLVPQPAERIEQMIAPVKENKRDMLAEALASAEAMYAASRPVPEAAAESAVTE
jgi:hypothetical protein